MDSILTSIKKLLGIAEEYEHFDEDIVIQINTVFMTLKQIGVGPSEGFEIQNDSSTWNQYIDVEKEPDKLSLLSAVKTYIYLKVKMVFDPPLNGSVAESIKQTISELEWRLNHESESK